MQRRTGPYSSQSSSNSLLSTSKQMFRTKMLLLSLSKSRASSSPSFADMAPPRLAPAPQPSWHLSPSPCNLDPRLPTSRRLSYARSTCTGTVAGKGASAPMRSQQRRRRRRAPPEGALTGFRGQCEARPDSGWKCGKGLPCTGGSPYGTLGAPGEAKCTRQRGQRSTCTHYMYYVMCYS
eukprot:scaffold764_cov408-Prasinococcus_capsulatus_cf.AAC.1